MPGLHSARKWRAASIPFAAHAAAVPRPRQESMLRRQPQQHKRRLLIQITTMDSETKLHMQVAEMILSLSDEQHQLSRSDFQSRVEVVARKIIVIVRDARQLR